MFVNSKTQNNLTTKRVLCVGAGGLGAVALYTLAGAGIGSIGIADGDAVEASNLDRQILFSQAMIGRNKAEAAAERLKQLHPKVLCQPYAFYANENNAKSLIHGYDLVIAAVDTLTARLLLNRACVHEGIPLVCGGVDGLSGMLQTVTPGSACLDCIYGGIVPSEHSPTSNPAVVAAVSSLMAEAALDLLTGHESPLQNSILLFDASSYSLSKLQICKNPLCKICSQVKS